ncbi:hypothetical protein GCM10009127_20450 [Alteraurantiacibacter aestuarii]
MVIPLNIVTMHFANGGIDVKKKMIALALGATFLWSAPASATFYWGGSSGGSSGGYSTSGGFWGGSSGGSSGGHHHYAGCGHYTGSSTGGSSTGGSTGSSTGGTTTTTTTSTSSGTQVPEPGMLGMFGLGLAGIALGRRRRRKR